MMRGRFCAPFYTPSALSQDTGDWRLSEVKWVFTRG
jgi:hypothetical protein